jgi:hypothetical protein
LCQLNNNFLFLSHHSPWQPLFYFLLTKITLEIWLLHMSGISRILWMAHCTYYNVFKVHLGCSMCLNDLPILRLNNIHLYILFTSYSSINRYMVCFHILAIVSMIL